MYLVKIERRTSPYNKYIKWFANGESEETGSKFSFGYRTLKEAREANEAHKVIEIKTKRSVWKNRSYQ